MNSKEPWPPTTVGNLRDISLSERQVVTRVDRTTVFGNPYIIGPDGDRIEVIETYKLNFYESISLNPMFKDKILTLMGKKLYCWCDPEPCHAHTIADYLNSLADEHNAQEHFFSEKEVPDANSSR